MTTIDPNVVDTHLTRGLRERAADLGDEDRFYQQVLATIALQPQRRWFDRQPAGFGRRTSLLLVAAALVGLLAGTAAVGGFLRQLPAPPAGVWTAAGAMISDHLVHTATLLPDGRVLVAGSAGPDQKSFAELYDPASGSWTGTGGMINGRGDHTATLLLDGRVLVTGGWSEDGTQATAELYDPATGTWTATGRMTQARAEHTATLLLDGRVLVAGGANPATSELYDPRNGTWTPTGNLVEDRFDAAATRLRDGRVLVAGPGEPGKTAELYDPTSGTWTATGPMIRGRYQVDSSATLLPDGRVLVAGGDTDASFAELYDPRSGTWTATGPMIQLYGEQSTATLLPDGTVLVAGGVGTNKPVYDVDPAVSFAELYDPRTGTWTATADMSINRRYHTATLLPDGRVLVAGGAGDNGAAGSAELYDPGTRN